MATDCPSTQCRSTAVSQCHERPAWVSDTFHFYKQNLRNNSIGMPFSQLFFVSLQRIKILKLYEKENDDASWMALGCRRVIGLRSLQ